MTLNVKRLNDKQLQELWELETLNRVRKTEDVMSRLLETCVMIMGKKGRGKTLSAVSIAYTLREAYQRQVVIVGAKAGLKPAFGPSQYMDERAFRDELERMTVAASEEENAQQVASSFEKYGVSLLGATVIFDEARKLLNSRRAADKLVQLVGDYVMQSRHYHNTIIILAPGEDEIDKRVVRQVDWKGRCFHNKYSHICHVKLTQGLETLNLDIDGTDSSMHVPFYDMYDSWTMLGYRQTSLKINNM